MVKDVRDRLDVGDEGYDGHGCAARTQQRLNFEHPLEKPRPRGTSSLHEGRRVIVFRTLRCCLSRLAAWRDVIATSVGAVMPGQMLPWPRYLHGHGVNPVKHIEAPLGFTGLGVWRRAQADATVVKP